MAEHFEVFIPRGSEREKEFLETTGVDIETIFAETVKVLHKAQRYDQDKFEKKMKEVTRYIVDFSLANTENALEQVAMYAAISKTMVLTLLATIEHVQLQMELYEGEN